MSGYRKAKLILGIVLLCAYGAIHIITAPQRVVLDAKEEQEWKDRTVEEYTTDRMIRMLESEKPDDWEWAYILTEIPEGFEQGISGGKPFGSVISGREVAHIRFFAFEKWKSEIEELEKGFDFIESKSVEYDESLGYVTAIENPQDDIYYYGQEEGMNVVFWFDEGYTLYIKDRVGNMTLEELESIASYVEVYEYKTTNELLDVVADEE